MAEANPDEYIRVKDKDTGYKLSIMRRSFEQGAFEELKGEDAVDAGGTPYPPDTSAAASKTTPAKTEK